jgi:hypothetical protein
MLGTSDELQTKRYEYRPENASQFFFPPTFPLARYPMGPDSRFKSDKIFPSF